MIYVSDSDVEFLSRIRCILLALFHMFQLLAKNVLDLDPSLRRRLYSSVTGLENLCVYFGGLADTFAMQQRRAPRMPTAAQFRSTDLNLVNEIAASTAYCRSATSIADIIRFMSSNISERDDRCAHTKLTPSLPHSVVLIS